MTYVFTNLLANQQTLIQINAEDPNRMLRSMFLEM